MSLPPIVSTGWILIFFAVAIALLHLFLVVLPWFRLTSRQWKQAGYGVVALASLGLFGAVSSARQRAATNMYNFYGPAVENDFASVRHSADFYALPVGTVCRTFVRSEYSPPPREFDKAQHDYDQACQWFRQLVAALPKEMPAENGEISWSSLPTPPAVPEADLNEDIQQFRKMLDIYNDEAKGRRKLGIDAGPSDLEQFLLFTTPLFLSFALALQATKVTGELRNERIR